MENNIIRSDYSALDEITKILSCLQQESNPSVSDYDWAIAMIRSEVSCTGRHFQQTEQKS